MSCARDAALLRVYCAHNVRRARKKWTSWNIVFLSKKAASNTHMMDAVSSGIMRSLTLETALSPNIVFPSKRRHKNIVLLSKDYCAPG
jgi:hypothetical protein